MRSIYIRLWSHRFSYEVLLVILLSWAINGCCVPLPTPEHGILEGRGKIDEKDRALLKVGTTSREDVLLRFGEPDVTVCNERVLAYYWRVKWGYAVIVVGGPYGAAGPLESPKLLMFEFDEWGKLKRFEETSVRLQRFYPSREVEKWMPLDCPKPKYRSDPPRLN